MNRLLVILFALSGVGFAAGSPQTEHLLGEAERLSSQQVRDSGTAVPLFREAIRLARGSGQVALEARAWSGLGMALLHLHDHTEAERALSTAVFLARRNGSAADETMALLALAGLARDRGDVEDQQHWIRAMLELEKRTGYLPARLRGLNFQVAVLRRHGRAAEAVEEGRLLLKEIETAAAAGKDVPAVLFFQVPYNLGKALADTGEHAEGIALLERAYDDAKQQKMLGGIWHVLHDTGEIHALTGDIEAAARYYMRALEVARKLDSRDPEALTLQGLGSVAESHGDLETAMGYYSKSVALLERSVVEPEMPKSLVSLSRVQWRAGLRKQAQESLGRAIEIAARTEDSSALAMAHLELGRQREGSGAFAEAVGEYRQALDIATRNGLQSFVPSAWNGIARIARKRRDFPQALRAYSAAADAVDAMRVRLPSEQQRISFVETTHEVYRGWVDTLLESNDRNQAFLVLERERSRNLLDSLQESGLEQHQVQDPRERAIEAHIAQLQIQLESSPLLPLVRRELLQQLEDEERKLNLWAGSARTAYSATAIPPSLASAQRMLHPDEMFVAYAPRADRVLIFALTRERLQVHSVPIQELGNRITLFAHALSESNEVAAFRAGLPLSNGLIRPLNLPSSIRRLIVAGSGEIAALPFAALPDPESRSPLLTRVEIAYAPSIAALSVMRARLPADSSNSVMAVAPLGALPASIREIERISSLMDADVDTLVGSAATEAAIKRRPLRDYRVLHFASHAELDPRFPSRSAIELAASGQDDGRLQIREIYRLDLADQLVVLSACDTASGRMSAAEGMQSLARAFTHAGARTVVGTLWRVEDGSAARLVESMYRRLANGATVAAALRDAQMALAGDRPYAVAATWAPWIATGDSGTHTLVRSASTIRRAAFVSITVIALLFGAYAVARRSIARRPTE